MYDCPAGTRVCRLSKRAALCQVGRSARQLRRRGLTDMTDCQTVGGHQRQVSLGSRRLTVWQAQRVIGQNAYYGARIWKRWRCEKCFQSVGNTRTGAGSVTCVRTVSGSPSCPPVQYVVLGGPIARSVLRLPAGIGWQMRRRLARWFDAGCLRAHG